MTVTIKKIAEIAGVSRGTVDRALNDRDGINKEVAENILKIAEELGYRPNVVAKALSVRNKGNFKLGIILNSEGNPFYDQVIEGINAAKKEYADFGVKVMMRTLRGYNPEEQIAVIDEVLKEKVNGLAISPIDSGLIVEKLKKVVALGIPVVAINTDIPEVQRVAYVGCDYVASGHTAAGMMGLITNGSCKAGVVIGSLNVRGHKLRAQGFKEIVAKEYPGIEIVDTVINDDDDLLSYKVITKLLTEHPEITALYFTAAGVRGGIQAIEDIGRAGTISVITCDLTPVVKEKLKEEEISATICQEPFRQGYDSVKILFDYVVGKKEFAQDSTYTNIEIKLKYNI